MSEQDNGQLSTVQRPTNDDPEVWKEYWKAQGQPWRTEPEIDKKRQHYLSERRKIVLGGRQGIYPFKNIKLNRADVEWLLATHEDGQGPINWKDEKQRGRQGIDLRGADLPGVNLSKLPLACLVGGLRQGDDATVYYSDLREFAGEIAAIHLEGTDLSQADLTEASLRSAHLENASLLVAHLEGASLSGVHLEDGDLRGARLEISDLRGAHLERAKLNEAILEGADMRTAHLEGADLSSAHLEGVSLKHAHLEGADLREAFISTETALNDVTLSNSQGSTALLADIHWSDVNVAVVNWSALSILGDELLARQTKSDGTKVDELYRIELYETALRAYRQLATTLRNQGLNEDAARFAYRAQLMQRKVSWYQRKFGQYLFSLFLDMLAGYGFKPWRSFVAYLIVIATFATAYFIIGHTVGPVLSPLGSVVFSMTSFHGRGFFPGNNIQLDDPLTVLAALEAFVGLLIEVTFIATLTQRLFGK
jgi:uncharacterized protein YjbI with pentapeptide repeats